jgi:hypothetical protein
VHNIIQAEFFLINFDASRDQVLYEAVERDLEGSPLKVCVRFYEDGKDITALMREYKAVKDRLLFITQTPAAGKFRRWRLNRRSKKLLERLRSLQEEARRLIIGRLVSCTRLGGPIVVESDRHIYRRAKPDEFHELLESVKRSRKMWVYIFEFNDLSAKNMQMVGSIF